MLWSLIKILIFVAITALLALGASARYARRVYDEEMPKIEVEKPVVRLIDNVLVALLASC